MGAYDKITDRMTTHNTLVATMHNFEIYYINNINEKLYYSIF